MHYDAIGGYSGGYRGRGRFGADGGSFGDAPTMSVITAASLVHANTGMSVPQVLALASRGAADQAAAGTSGDVPPVTSVVQQARSVAAATGVTPVQVLAHATSVVDGLRARGVDVDRGSILQMTQPRWTSMLDDGGNIYGADPNEANYGNVDRGAHRSRPLLRLLAVSGAGAAIGALAIGGPLAIIGGLVLGGLTEEAWARLTVRNIHD